METSPISIILVPFKTKTEPAIVDSIYAFVDSENPNAFSLIEHPMDAKEPSTIYSATRLLLNKVIDRTRYPNLIFEEKYQDYEWREKTYQSFLGRMVNAPLAEFEGRLVFFFELTEDMIIQEGKLKAVPLKDFQATHPSLAKELNEALDPVATQKWPRLAIFVCEPQDRWANHYEALYKGLYHSPREIWRSYRVHKSEFPSEEELKQLKGIVVSGSGLGAYEPVEWYPKFEEIIRSVVNDHPPTKLLGVCFGHQIIAQALGGRVTKMKLADRPYCLGRETITFTESANPFTDEAFKKLTVDGKFYAIEIHGDHVEEAPPGARVIGKSKATAIEIFEVGKSVLCTQFHPEFNAFYMEKKLFRDEAEDLKSRYPNIDEVLEASVKQMNETRCDNRDINKILKTFLKS